MNIARSRTRAALALLIGAGLCTMATPATAQERYAVGGEHVAIYNLAGNVEVVGTTTGQVTVEMERAGRHADRLRVEVGDVDGRQALRVIYPSDEVHYDPPGWNGSSTVRVNSDGTWGGDGGGWLFGGGERVRVSSRRSGMDAHANLRIGVPRGQRVDVYLAVGRIRAENVDGRVRLDTGSGRVGASSMAGDLTIDTGSGSVEVSGMAGDLLVDTGSGGVGVSGMEGSSLRIDTGSGSVDVHDSAAENIEIDTGSGSIDLVNSAARNLVLDTGSGSVEAELTRNVERMMIDTGSGGVSLRLPEDLGARLDLESGSGGIDVDFPVDATERSRDELRGQIGDGRGYIEIDTGSGGIRIRRI